MNKNQKEIQSVLEAVERLRELAKEKPAEYLLDLSKSLFELGTLYRESGLIEEGIRVTKEAIEIHGKFAEP